MPNYNPHALFKIGFSANVFEAYEFSIYGFLVPVIGRLFLPEMDSEKLFIQSYLLFAVSFFARPIGSLLWGYLADHIGRTRTLKITLFVMSVPTALIGVLPTYSQIGSWATFSFLGLRFLQGFSMGGEQAISACYVYESAPRKYRSLLCSVVGASSIIGMLAGSSVAWLLFYFFDQDTLEKGAWRVPYLFGILITLWIARMRNAMQETSSIHTHSTEASNPLTQQEKLIFIKRLIPVVCIGGFMQICSYTLFVWLPSYLSHFLNIDPPIAQFCNTLGYILWVGFILLAGYCSSIYGYKRVMFWHTFAMVIAIVPLFLLLSFSTYSALMGAYVFFAWLHSGLSAVMMEVLGDTFPKKIRAFGMSFSQNLSATLFGGTAGLVNSILVKQIDLLIAPALYIAATGIITLMFIIRLKPFKEN